MSACIRLIRNSTAIAEAQAEGKPLWKIAKTSARDAWREMEPAFKQIAAVLDELQTQGWLDDRRAAEALLHQRSARLGHIRLRQVLQQKGIDADISQELLHAAAQTESERAHALWQKKFGTLPTTPAERARQMRFLASRGFSAAIIQRIMRHAPDDDFA